MSIWTDTAVWCCRRAQQHLLHGAPFVVRNCRKRMNWDPSCMNRALKDTSPTELEVQHLRTVLVHVFLQLLVTFRYCKLCGSRRLGTE